MCTTQRAPLQINRNNTTEKQSKDIDISNDQVNISLKIMFLPSEWQKLLLTTTSTVEDVEK